MNKYPHEPLGGLADLGGDPETQHESLAQPPVAPVVPNQTIPVPLPSKSRLHVSKGKTISQLALALLVLGVIIGLFFLPSYTHHSAYIDSNATAGAQAGAQLDASSTAFDVAITATEATGAAQNATVGAHLDASATASDATEEAKGQVIDYVNQHINQYLNIPNLYDPGKPYSSYLRGNVIVIDRQGKHVDTQVVLPDTFWASTPQGIGTIIWEDCQYIQEGNYVLPATWARCDLTIIDKAKAIVVGRKHFDGEYPPQTITCSAIAALCTCCDPPYEDMANYIIKSLPRK